MLSKELGVAYKKSLKCAPATNVASAGHFTTSSNLCVISFSQNLDKAQLEQILMGRYQVIAGAWFVNKQCSFLSETESAMLEKHVAGINVYAQHNQLAPTEILLQMQKNAQFGALLPTYKQAKTAALRATGLAILRLHITALTLNMEIRTYEEKDENEVVSLWGECGLVVTQNDPAKDIERKLKVDPIRFIWPA